MPTQQLINGLSGNLQSSTTWAQQQALELIQRNVRHALRNLTPKEQADYIKLQGQAQTALANLDTEKNAVIKAFKTDGLAQLRARLNGRDPEQYRIKTTYLEKLEHPFPWEPARSESSPDEPGHHDLLRRSRRAYDESRFKEHIKSMTLWEAACLNFGITHSIRQKSGYSLVEASTIEGPGEPLDTAAFVKIAREMNLGGQLQLRTQRALAINGRLRSLFATATQAMLQFELLDSWRNRADTGLTRPMYDALLNALASTDSPLKFDTLKLGHRAPSLFTSSIPLPLLLIRVASIGVVSYFPFRPGGAFVYHIDSQAAEASLRQQLNDSHQRQDLGWFSRQLPLAGLTLFKSLLKEDERPQALSWLAGHLYDGFHHLFQPYTLQRVRFLVDPKPAISTSLSETLGYLHIQRYKANLETLATTRSDADWQAIKDAVAALAGEILELLTLPMPGGVTGMNRIMQLAVTGSLGYSAVQSVGAAFRGEPSDFAQTLSDVADLAISGRLITIASRVHQQRMLGYLQTLGNPHKVTRADGVDTLWTPNARPYAIANQHLLDGRTADALGLYTVNDKTYAKLREADQSVVAEVSHDMPNMRYVLKHADSNQYTPPIVFDPTVQAWVFDLKNTHTLSDAQLLQRMLPNGSSTTPTLELDQMLRSTTTTRTALDAVWNAQPAPLNLIEGVRRLQADQVIQQVIDHFKEPGYLPPHGDSLVFCVMTQLPNWPVDTVLNVHDEQGVLLESYSKSAMAPAQPSIVHLTRQYDGRYADADNQRLAPGTVDPLMRLIIRQQPATSTLGKDEVTPTSEDQRIATVRDQIVESVEQERITLFSALVNYAGHEKSELAAPPLTRRYLPLKAPAAPVTVTPLLKKLRDLYRPLTPANLQRLLEQEPLTPRQRQDFLQNSTLPLAFHEFVERQRTALRIDSVIDSLYHPREFAEDSDQWAREFASALVQKTLKRPFIVIEVANGETYKSTGPDDPTVELRHYGDGNYQAYDMRNGGVIAVSPVVDSLYLAIASVLQPHEHRLLGMSSASDAKGLRKTLGDYMSKQRSPEGTVSLANGSLVQYEHPQKLPPLKPAANGLYTLNARHYLPLFGSLYQVVFDKQQMKWRLVHPKKTGVNTPTLEHNNEGAWRLSSENPMTWDDHRLFYRLGNHQFAFTQDMAGKIMALTDTTARTLRQVHCSGQAAPPLLADTCKRFKINEEIQLFIQAMRADPTAAPARPALQLLVLSGLPGWPVDHALQIVDSQQQVQKQYPANPPPNAEIIKVTEQDYHAGKLLGIVLKNDKVCQGLLDGTPTSDSERLFKLMRKIVAFTEQERVQVFNSIYAHSELNGSALQKSFKAKCPDLPNSTLKAILDRATPREIQQLHEKNQLGLRLAEQARVSSHDLRLNRAYEGLFVPACANADSDKITLFLLKSLPDWPSTLRIDIHQDSYQGPWLESAGHLGGAVRRRVARIDHGYQAYDTSGNPLGTPTNSLLHALANCLSAKEQTALGITERDGVSSWREQIVALALGSRVDIKALLGLPHLQPWMQPPMQVDRSFMVYPLWNRFWPFGGNRPPDLVSRVQEVYPSFDTRAARDFISSLNMSEPDTLIELERRQAEYRSMDTELTRWSDTHQAVDDTQPVGHYLTLRQRVANQLRRAWRHEERQTYLAGLFQVSSLDLSFGACDLPPASFLSGSSGFAHIEHLKLSGDTFPDSGEAFLTRFSGLKALEIHCNLTELPPAVTDMNHLVQLDLSSNQLVLTEAASARLASLVNLQTLNLSHNPLGNAPDVSRLSQLTYLRLRDANITQWPAGAWELTGLLDLHLQDNFISTIPEHVFTNPQLAMTNRNTFLHDNPLSQAMQERITRYRNETGINLGGIAQGVQHTPPATGDIELWLRDVPASQHSERRTLWDQLLANESARPDDVFQVLRDLPATYAYGASTDSRQALSNRVWTLLLAMGESTELRNNVCLNTFGSGNCGDSALLAFTKMELEHRIHQAKSKSRTYDNDRALIALATGCFYLNQLDEIAYRFNREREEAGLEVDRAEVTIYFRANLAVEFNLPFYPLELLYTVESYVTPQVLDDARAQLRQLGQSPALQESLLMEAFWIEYLARSHPEPFTTVKQTIEYKVDELNKELPDQQSDQYLERRQSMIDLEVDEYNRLVRQLTEATQAAIGRA